MPRGGKREGAGRKLGWSRPDTKVIRVPSALSDRLLEIAHWLDSGGEVSFRSSVEPAPERKRIGFESAFNLRPHPSLKALSGRGLARRFSKAPSTVNSRRDRADFIPWSSANDPEQVPWLYHKDTGLFHPYEFVT